MVNRGHDSRPCDFATAVAGGGRRLLSLLVAMCLFTWGRVTVREAISTMG
jgi:hypothetical protein